MRAKKALIFLVSAFVVCIFAGVLAACSSGGGNYTDVPDGYKSVKVVYELEGGEYKNSTRAVTQYYTLEEGKSSLIKDPATISSKDITLPEHHIEAWCRTKNADGTYSDPWDFDFDKINSDMDTLTLYCKWARNIVYTYEICYWDEDGNAQYVNSYTVSEGDPFNDLRNLANSRSGYTAERKPNEDGAYEVVYYQENGEVWDSSFTHPGGDESLAIRVFVNYIKGEFNYVSTAEEFLAANKSHRGVWLLNDIDLEGKSVNSFSTGRFRSAFYGNGYTVSNFTLTYSSGNNDLTYDEELYDGTNGILCISLFGNLDDAIIENVSFENVSVEISSTNRTIGAIYVAPIGIKSTNSTVSNVSFSGTFTLTGLPRGFAESDLHIVTDSLLWQTGVTGDDCSVSVDLVDARG